MHFSLFRVPSVTNWADNVVFPLPGGPLTMYSLSSGNPPSRSSSNPSVPVEIRIGPDNEIPSNNIAARFLAGDVEKNGEPSVRRRCGTDRPRRAEERTDQATPSPR